MTELDSLTTFASGNYGLDLIAGRTDQRLVPRQLTPAEKCVHGWEKRVSCNFGIGPDNIKLPVTEGKWCPEHGPSITWQTIYGMRYCEAPKCTWQWKPETLASTDSINPPYYRQHPSGVECIEITRHMGFNLGNAIKYIWRAGLKSTSAVEDLQKAIWYLNDEIKKLESSK